MDEPRSLLSINRTLMNKSHEKKNYEKKNYDKKPKDKIVFRIWTKEKNQNVFQSEASTLNFFNRKWPRNKCPYCGAFFHNKDIKEKSDTSWVFICPGCKSTLIVLNE
jgi:hypothetical protein